MWPRRLLRACTENITRWRQAALRHVAHSTAHLCACNEGYGCRSSCRALAVFPCRWELGEDLLQSSAQIARFRAVSVCEQRALPADTFPWLAWLPALFVAIRCLLLCTRSRSPQPRTNRSVRCMSLPPSSAAAHRLGGKGAAGAGARRAHVLTDPHTRRHAGQAPSR